MHLERRGRITEEATVKMLYSENPLTLRNSIGCRTARNFELRYHANLTHALILLSISVCHPYGLYGKSIMASRPSDLSGGAPWPRK